MRATTPPLLFHNNINTTNNLPYNNSGGLMKGGFDSSRAQSGASVHSTNSSDMYHHTGNTTMMMHNNNISSYQQSRMASQPTTAVQYGHAMPQQQEGNVPTTYHQLVLPRSRPTTPTAPSAAHSAMGHQPQQQEAPNTAPAVLPPSHNMSGYQQQQSYNSHTTPMYVPYNGQQQQYRPQSATVQASIEQYQAKVQQEQLHYQRLEQDEAAMTNEETQLRSAIERQRGQLGDEMARINDQWATLWDQEEWLQNTPFLDLSQEIAEAEYRCNALRQHMGDRQAELKGLEIELQRYEGNAVAQQRVQNALAKVEQCAEKLEGHRRSLQMRAEKLFEAETHRDRAALRHLQDVQEAIRRCESTLHLTSTTMSAPTSRAGSAATQRDGSVAPNTSDDAPPRTRIVSFGPSPVVPRRVTASSFNSSTSLSSSYNNMLSEDSILLDGPTMGSSSASHRNNAGGHMNRAQTQSYNRSDEEDGFYGGLGGESIAISMCALKKPKREGIAA